MNETIDDIRAMHKLLGEDDIFRFSKERTEYKYYTENRDITIIDNDEDPSSPSYDYFIGGQASIDIEYEIIELFMDVVQECGASATIVYCYDKEDLIEYRIVNSDQEIWFEFDIIVEESIVHYSYQTNKQDIVEFSKVEKTVEGAILGGQIFRYNAGLSFEHFAFDDSEVLSYDYFDIPHSEYMYRYNIEDGEKSVHLYEFDLGYKTHVSVVPEEEALTVKGILFYNTYRQDKIVEVHFEKDSITQMNYYIDYIEGKYLFESNHCIGENEFSNICEAIDVPRAEALLLSKQDYLDVTEIDFFELNYLEIIFMELEYEDVMEIKETIQELKTDVCFWNENEFCKDGLEGYNLEHLLGLEEIA